MNKLDYIQAIIVEMERVWSGQGFEGHTEQYIWLVEHYDITEEEDVQWQLILEDSIGELPEEEEEDEELIAFLDDEQAVCEFLQGMLERYRGNTIAYPRSA